VVNGYFVLRADEPYERQKFRAIVFQKGETVYDVCLGLRAQAECCSCGINRNEMQAYRDPLTTVCAWQDLKDLCKELLSLEEGNFLLVKTQKMAHPHEEVMQESSAPESKAVKLVNHFSGSKGDNKQ
jgi:hypothetical protein